MAIPARYQKIVHRWKQIPLDYSEQGIELHLVQPMFEALGYSTGLVKSNVSLGTGSGLKADHLIFTDPTQPPVLVVEVKKRIAALANAASDEDFLKLCHQPNSLYRLAVGYRDGSNNNNGICQYLNKSNSNIHPNRLASYGLVINGDFFQLWRRVDGLVLPLTPLQRMTANSIPKLMQQLEHCFNAPKRALITAIWNRKGGVAKTTNTLNLGAVLALAGKKVLLIDLDTQTDLTRSFQIHSKDHKDCLYQCFTDLQAGKTTNARAILKHCIGSRSFPTIDKKSFSLDILAGEQDTLVNIRDDKTNFSQRDKVKILKKMLDILAKDYDYIFIDVSPARDDLMVMMLFGCDTLLIPSDYSRKTLHHAADLYQMDAKTVRDKREQQDKLYIGPWNLGLVFSNCPTGVTPTSQLERCIQKELQKKNFIGKQCKTRLAIYAQTKLAEYKNAPVICWQNSPITKLYHKLVEEIFLQHHFLDD
ncbi:AAA family ATPase [Oscillatoria sp. FACHB-1406]|uniref:ParA family protein n=1 Tax=Oscillatoria sp. FACHB-1406 TaxID=2692846 RepID=UPI001685F809|nr:AAA family ATPase [Oscillatoria sp. FACHB-1406]MBD2578988.1 AAA family ATPase [Oscillatoria sp. FACHB-1406]